MPAPEPGPLLNADPNTWIPLPRVLLADPRGLRSEPAEPAIEMADVSMDVDVAIPDARPVPDVAAADDEIAVAIDEIGDVDGEDDVAVAASPAAGIAAELSGVVTAVVNGDTVCTLVPAEVPAACATAAVNPPIPAGLVFGSGVVNGVNADAADDAPA